MPTPIQNPPNPWDSSFVEWLGEPPMASLEVFEEAARSIISKNQSPDVGFRYSVNPYRGCFHACSYCYARPSHQYLGFGAGTDFDRKIVVKTNAPKLLRKEFSKNSWQGEVINFSGNTDCYQPLEASYQLTRDCFKVCTEFCNPVVIITKSALVRRDIDILQTLHQKAQVHVYISLGFLDTKISQAIEPSVGSPNTRLQTIRVLAKANIPVGIALGPVIPGLNEKDIPILLQRAKEAGAQRAFLSLLRLPNEVKTVFETRLSQTLPQKYSKIKRAFQEVTHGRNENAFGERMRGTGPRWKLITKLFQMTCQKLGLNQVSQRNKTPNTFQRPKKQLNLFSD